MSAESSLLRSSGADDRIPVVWLCGPPGVGKSTVAWEVFSQLADGGRPLGYVDIDQLGICYPGPDDDPDRHRMKGRNLAAVVATFSASGATCVVVSGVVDPARVVGDQGLASEASLVWCRLRADPRELVLRLERRGLPGASIRDVLDEAEAMGTSTFADVVVDTDNRTVSEVAGSVLELVPKTLDDATRDRVDGRGVSQRTDDVAAPIHVDGPVLWLSGASAVGKSTVGWHVFQDALAAGRRTAFVDLEQIGFSCPARADDPSGHRVRARNLARLWSTFRSVGAECLVVVGGLGSAADLRPYTDTLPDVTWSLCRLRADRHSLAERIAVRRTGVGPDLAGDRLRHVDDDAATAALDAAVSASVVSDAAGLRWPVVDTDGATVDEIAQRVRAFAVGWPWPRVPS